jgi:hypothetical protein
VRAGDLLPPGLCTISTMAAATALALKEKGNSAFRKRDHAQARSLYLAALESLQASAPVDDSDVDDTVHHDATATRTVLHSNLAECGIRACDWDFALEHANAALVLDAGHAKSIVRKARAEAAVGLARSLPAGHGFSAEVVADAVAALEQLPRAEAPPHARVQFLSSAEQAESELRIEAMLQMTPSLYSAMQTAVREDIQLFGGRVNTMPISLAHHLLTTVLRGNRGNESRTNSFAEADATRSLAFLQTGVWPDLLKLARTMVDATQHSAMIINMITKPLLRFYGYMICLSDCAEYVLRNHCGTAAEIHALTDLMFLGDGEDSDIAACEGLTNQMAAVRVAHLLICHCDDKPGSLSLSFVLSFSLSLVLISFFLSLSLSQPALSGSSSLSASLCVPD